MKNATATNEELAESIAESEAALKKKMEILQATNSEGKYAAEVGRDLTAVEKKYLEVIDKRTDSGTVSNGVLRDPQSGNIILFEKIIDGQGTDGTSHPENYTLSYEEGYFDYEDTEEELNKIIKREFTEL